MKPQHAETKQNSKRREFVEGLDFYFENGLMVLTAHFLRERGYCCGNRCRHCPYQTTEAKEKDSLPVSPNSQ
ncbi:MAG: DUF5522 domain-containing protein [Acidobacteriota bacterium]|nr:DUF5522 domain-containing protein [Acidobacteriota bacterium]